MAEEETFDEYREKLVIETTTIWPEDIDTDHNLDRTKISDRLHANPKSVSQLRYIRQHTGFRREITVTSEDLKRL